MKAILLSLLLLITGTIIGQSTSDVVVPVTVTTSLSPLQNTLNFTAPAGITATIVAKKLLFEVQWTLLAQLPPTATSYIDTDLAASIGQPVEYLVLQQGTPQRIGLVYVGDHIDPVTYGRGKMLLLIDNQLSTPLAAELSQYAADLRGDGYQVVREDIDVSTATVANVKAKIATIQAANPELGMITLIGNLPVPYTGEMNPDAHPDHRGAWPADFYYGDLDETAWTDNTVNNTTAARMANWNIPGDGKFDQTETPTLPEMIVGRIDFSNLSGWDVSQTELYRRYLVKNHNFKVGKYKPARQTLIDDNFGYFSGEAFAQNGWRNGNALTGTTSIVQGDFFNDTDANSYLIGYGCGGGNYTSAGGVGSSDNFKTDSVNIVFSMLFGSYFGDWDYEDNPFMPAALASKGGILACEWAGRPHYHHHHMGMGEPIAISTLWTLYNSFLPNPVYPPGAFYSYAHVGLLGDPSLRLHSVIPPDNVVAATSCTGIELSWSASADATDGYLVYRAPHPDSLFELIVTAPISGTFYSDNAPLPGTNYYQVKSLKLEVVPTGSYYNQSIGKIVSAPSNSQPLEALLSSYDLTCAGQNNGQVTANVSGGFQPYSFVWTTNDTTATINNLPPGTYFVTITDNIGCTVVNSASVNTPTPVTLTLTATDITCFGDQNGSVVATVAGGVPGYTYLWNTNAQTASISGQGPGIYSVQVTDMHLCSLSSSVTITEPSPLILATAPLAVSCNGGSSGSIVTTVSGGSPNYTFAWQHGPVSQNLLGTLAAGVYTVVVSDAHGCTETITTTVTEPPVLDASATITSASCNGGTDGSISVVASGGDGNYTYLWSNNAATPTLTGLPAGPIGLTLTDGAGCTRSFSYIINQNSSMSVQSLTAADVQCNGGSDGSVSLEISGGTPGYTYLWSNNAVTQNLASVPAGNYSVTVTDAANCLLFSDVITVNEPDPLVVTPAVTGSLCPGQSVEICIAASGGTPGYAYQWSSNNTTPCITVNTPGSYTCTVTDTHNCSATSALVVVSSPDPIVVSSAVTSPLCAGGLGSISQTPGSPQAQYAYLWNTGAVTANLLQVPAGIYSCVVTDLSSGCETTFDYPVIQPTALLIQVTSTDETCPGASNGTAQVIGTGGSGAYTYLWSNGAVTPVIYDLAPDSYNVTVSDANNCTTVATVIIDPGPDAPFVTIQGPDTICISDFNPTHYFNLVGSVSDIVWNVSGTANQIISGQGTNEVEILFSSFGQVLVNASYSYGNFNACSSSVSNIVVVITCDIATKEPGLDGVTLAPNPFIDQISLNFDRGQGTKALCRVVDAQGKQLVSQTIAIENKVNLPLADLPQGVYFLSLQTEFGFGYWKIVKM